MKKTSEYRELEKALGVTIKPKEFRYISLGAGVQSTALLLMSTWGLHGCKKADAAIFADTQVEPKYIYDHVQRLREVTDIPIHIATYGNLGEDFINGFRNGGLRKGASAIPGFTMRPDGKRGILNRMCTMDYKIIPITKKLRELMGRTHRPMQGNTAVAMIGISIDEATRVKPALEPWITNTYPLIDAGLNRVDCMKLIQEYGWPKPEKSACVFCPYHDNKYWAWLKAQHPDEFKRAVEFDEQIRDSSHIGIEYPVFLHSSLKALREVDFGREQSGGTEGWDNECAGICGV